MSLKGDMRQLVRRKVKEGWSIERTRGGHLRWTHELTGKIIISPSTPSDYRSIRNTEADIRRCEKPLAACYI